MNCRVSLGGVGKSGDVVVRNRCGVNWTCWKIQPGDPRLEPAVHANAKDPLAKVHWIDAFGAASRDLSGGLSNAPDPVHRRSNLPGDRGTASRRTRRVLIRGRTNRSATSTSPPNRFSDEPAVCTRRRCGVHPSVWASAVQTTPGYRPRHEAHGKGAG